MNCRNLVEMQGRQAERQGPRTAFRWKQHGRYHDLSWEQYRADSLACAAALLDVGIEPGERVGLLSENRLEWLIADMGLLAAGAVNVPPHAPLSAKQIHYQLEDAGVRWLFVSTLAQAEKLRQVRGQLPQLRGVVLFDPILGDNHLHPWAGFLQQGRRALSRWQKELERREQQLGLDDLATIMYTSGTTGNPKGVMLTHGNLLSNAAATLGVSGTRQDSVILNWLPLSHIYARLVDHYEQLVCGFTLCLAESAETIVQNLEDVQPMHMASVPRFYEKVLTAVSSSDPAKTARRLRDIFGPRIEWLSSGGAPLPKPVAEAYHAAGLLLLQGYGLTETSPVLTFNRKDRFKIETVGLAIPGVELKVADDGELLTRGPQVMKGYWNNPEATAAAIRDGWFHTGDLAKIDGDGFVTITGRKKELLVLSNGKKVVPTYLEGLLIADPCIDQAVVCGEGRNFLTALIVPHWENLRPLLPEALHSRTEEALVAHADVQELLRQRIDRALRDEANWEQIRKFVMLPRPFTVAAEELTVSLKLRRNVVLAKYREEVEELYRE